MKQISKQLIFTAFAVSVAIATPSIAGTGAYLMAQETELSKSSDNHEQQSQKKSSATELGDSAQMNDGGYVWDLKMNGIDGQEVDLSIYKGKVAVVVNTASKCGFTRQYKKLEKIHQAHRSQGLVVLGFPCNQFGGQEPAGEKEIVEFCKSRFGVTFDLFAKSEVNGEGRNALYKKLCDIELQPKGAGDVSWNFEKFVIGRDGNPVGRFSSRVSPTDQEFVSLLEKELAKQPPTASP